jgi:predicted ATPase
LIDPRFLRGAAQNAQDASHAAVACLRDATTDRLGAITFRPYGFARLAEALARQGHHGPSLVVVSEGLKAQEETGVRRWGAELHRLEGIALAGLNRLEEAQNAFAEALHIARLQQAKSYELRAATSLGRLWGERGRRAEARDLLWPVYHWFTEGFGTADLKEAKGLLNELR